MTTIVSGVTFSAPTVERWQSRLLDHFPVQGGRSEPEDLYVSLNCLGLPDSRELCEVDPSLDPDDFRSGEVIQGVRFVSDIGIKCQALGFGDLGDQFNRNVAALESASVEQNLMTLRFTGVAPDTDPAEDITPAGGAVSPAVGVALLEGDAAKKYAGRPAIHSPVSVASLLLDTSIGFHQDGNTLRTSLGSRFIVGQGYEDNLGPDASAPDAGEMWMYATGGIDIVASRRVVTEPILDRSDNTMYLRSQRVYVVSVDCYLAAVRVKLYG